MTFFLKSLNKRSHGHSIGLCHVFHAGVNVERLLYGEKIILLSILIPQEQTQAWFVIIFQLLILVFFLHEDWCYGHLLSTSENFQGIQQWSILGPLQKMMSHYTNLDDFHLHMYTYSSWYVMFIFYWSLIEAHEVLIYGYMLLFMLVLHYSSSI